MAYNKPLLERIDLATDESSCCTQFGGCWFPTVPDPQRTVEQAGDAVGNAAEEGVNDLGAGVNGLLAVASDVANEGKEAVLGLTGAMCLLPGVGSAWSASRYGDC